MTRRGWWGDRGPRRHGARRVWKDSRDQSVIHEMKAEDHEVRARMEMVKEIRTGIPSRWCAEYAAKARVERDLAERYRRARSR